MALPSVLMGKRELAPRVSGKIRPGIMILTKNGQQNKRAQELYAQGVAAGDSFEEINDAISKECGNGLLRPINTQYFTVRRKDFGMPVMADMIMRHFGEVGDDNVKRLYRFPVDFGSDEITRFLDFRFQMFLASGPKFWSAESEDGKTRLCRTFAPLAKDEKTQRVVRMPGGRPVIARADNSGLCNPQQCTEFQSGQCKMQGKLYFNIPGIPCAGVFEVQTNSKNFGVDSEATLKKILADCGELPRLIDGKPVFWLTKRFRRNLPMIDYVNGKTTRTDQWIIEIEADLDMSRLRAAKQAPLLTQQAASAAGVLMGEEPAVPQLSAPPAPAPDAYSSSVTAAVTDPPTSGGGDVIKAPQQGDGNPVKKLRRDTNELLQAMGIDLQRYAVYAAGKWGATWSRTEAGLTAAIDELKAIGPAVQNVKTNLTALGITFELYDAYAKNAFGESWLFDGQMLPSVEEELVNAFSDRDNYVAAIEGLAEQTA